MDTHKYSIIDTPLQKGEKDKLGIGQYETGLTHFIKHANMPITIALQGEWGSGKTSLMNMLKNNLCEGDDAKFFSVWINTLKERIEKEKETVEEVVGDIISLSSVTNLDAFDRQPLAGDVHLSSFLKDLRDRLIKELKKQLPDIAKLIAPQGKRVKSNALIKFSKKDDECCIRLHAQSNGNGIELDISAKSLDIPAEKIVLPVKDFEQEDNLRKIAGIIGKLYEEIQKRINLKIESPAKPFCV